MNLRVLLRTFDCVAIPAGTAGEVFTTPATMCTTAGRCFTIGKQVLEIGKTVPATDKGFLPIPGQSFTTPAATEIIPGTIPGIAGMNGRPAGFCGCGAGCIQGN